MSSHYILNSTINICKAYDWPSFQMTAFSELLLSQCVPIPQCQGSFHRVLIPLVLSSLTISFLSWPDLHCVHFWKEWSPKHNFFFIFRTAKLKSSKRVCGGGGSGLSRKVHPAFEETINCNTYCTCSKKNNKTKQSFMEYWVIHVYHKCISKTTTLTSFWYQQVCDLHLHQSSSTHVYFESKFWQLHP